MTWHDLLFLHWPVPEDQLRPLVPDSLAIETRCGSAWIGVIPFTMTDVAPRGVPALPQISSTPEINVRTYVTDETHPGVWFCSLDAQNPLAVGLARVFFHLPYYRARMRSESDKEGWIYYRTTRLNREQGPVRFHARYRPSGEPFRPEPGTLEHFFVNRYCLYSEDQYGTLYRCDIHHKPWRIQPARAEVKRNTMGRPIGCAFSEPAPQIHYARKIRAVSWLPQKL